MKVSCSVALMLITVDVALAADSSSGSGSTIIYVVIGVVVFLFILAALFVWKRKQNRREDGPARLEAGDGVPNVRRGNAYDIHHSPAALYQEPHGHPYSGGIDDRRDGRQRQHQSGLMRQERPFNGERHDRPVPPRPVSNVNRQQQYQQPQPPNREVNQERNLRPVRSEPVAHPPPPPPRSNVSEGNARSREVAARVLAEFQADPSLGRRRIPYSALYFTRVLSKGAFGEVWLAQLENKQVAVKRILNEKKNDEKEIECFAAEIKLMASFYHPKIVEFVGVSWSTLQDLCAVTEYMAKGDLYGFLKRKNGQLNWRDHKAYLAEDVAEALGYLHSLSPKVIHRDLKSKNILLDDSFRAKLSDFGISRERSLEETMTAGVGTIYWTAPEVLMGKKYTEKADIYSFGIVMSELDTHEVPYSDKRDEAGKKLQGMKIVQMVIKKKLRPSFSASCPEIVHDLAMRCLDADPDVRPDANELRTIIQRIQNQL